MFSRIAFLGVITSVAAHGTVSGIVADGILYFPISQPRKSTNTPSYQGYNPSYQYLSPLPIIPAWSTPTDLDNGFVAPTSYTDPDIICHKSATNAQIAAPVRAGGKVEFQWTPWPTSHKGPMIDYLANCNGPCETVDKTTLKWFKIDALGLINPTQMTDGYWASDVMIANNNSWTVTIPPIIAQGNYVVRHETIALHAAGSVGGAQNYPFCFNLAVTSSGSDNPAGTLGEALYKETDPGIVYDIYQSTLASYTIPGPLLYTGAVSLTQTLPLSPTASASGIANVKRSFRA